ncbi:MAG: selenium-dependent molybdenum cofactor biosynthesis protein YqeB [Acidimicrobiia bacterium]|nr:selenium-dependent molybdenum cofactor biosynthesis protein YqeB [Acidimicrobiia bacterium]
MLFGDHLVVVRGGGDLATGTVFRLQKAGFPVLVLELEQPLAIRRTVAVASAVIEGRALIEDLDAILIEDIDEALETARSGAIPVMVSPTLLQLPWEPSVVVDARLAKQNLDTSLHDAPLVVGLGPGFTAGVDCHAVIETMRGHFLGRVIWEGTPTPNTGEPGMIGGKSSERVVRAPTFGILNWKVAIADTVAAGDVLGDINGVPVRSRIGGVVRGLLAEGYEVEWDWKIADIDPRSDPSACFEISDKALSIGGGVIEAILTWLDRRSQ